MRIYNFTYLPKIKTAIRITKVLTLFMIEKSLQIEFNSGLQRLTINLGSNYHLQMIKLSVSLGQFKALKLNI